MTDTSLAAALALPDLPAGIAVRGAVGPGHVEILTPAALAFVAALHRAFDGRRRELLQRRRLRQRALDAGERPDFLPETAAVRAGDWSIAPTPEALRDRTVEITGPVDRKMIVNALNSGANVFMADFEDSSTPTWANMVDGQRNLLDAVRRRIDFVHEATGKEYRLGPKPSLLFVRPRGWHLDEKHLTVDGAPVAAGLFDFGLFFFHNARELARRGEGPFCYLPKLENHLEARLWNDVFVFAQDALGLARGTIKATVLIEHVLAAFEMDEILFELRDHSAGLNCGRWDYIFSFIKTFRRDPACVLPDRATVGMDRRFLDSYSKLLVRTCHRRGAHAMGGMAAQIPLKDAGANAQAIAKVRADKRREARNGHDGTWVAHPGLVAVARAEFDDHLTPRDRQSVVHADLPITADDLLAVPEGTITERGLRQNLEVGVRYLEAWLRGTGCVPIHGLMEDAATAEISRTQVWQWLAHGALLDDRRRVDTRLVGKVLGQELAAIRAELGDERFDRSRFELARQLFERLITADDLEDFLTLRAYEHV